MMNNYKIIRYTIWEHDRFNQDILWDLKSSVDIHIENNRYHISYLSPGMKKITSNTRSLRELLDCYKEFKRHVDNLHKSIGPVYSKKIIVERIENGKNITIVK